MMKNLKCELKVWSMFNKINWSPYMLINAKKSLIINKDWNRRQSDAYK
jgi:hypothetical protein